MKSKHGLLFLLVASLLLFVSACGNSSPIKDPLNYEVQSFQYTNQDGKSVSLEDLQGDVWVANFIFTSCTTVCPPMTAHMSELQDKIAAEGLDAKIISFSVDPEIDTPEKLKKFTEPYSLSFENWSFLTGYSQKEIENFAMKSFKTFVKKPDNDDQVIHQTRFYLVDQNGVVMKDYSGVENPPLDQMIADIKALVN
ncbi:SCO family protein [Metabacillus rhizolycopersici]|jgi:protein SCO1|uniref:SCO family protein n=1 Tax=Metabacillus rhizolycopersici TaxID=2875709 RepID=A0ABS7ULX4_9BACI|nr:SCO family protein [Metabacillus rhizolycopersici]MBZ5749209.1 SCO family protein [Metabacillus rhizolycopersici]